MTVESEYYTLDEHELKQAMEILFKKLRAWELAAINPLTNSRVHIPCVDEWVGVSEYCPDPRNIEVMFSKEHFLLYVLRHG